MGTKMKGLIKGLRYISQIFDEEKDQDIQIGFPTDVKHVAHIGWDGPSTVDSSPSWMKEFDAPSQFQSAPLGMIGGPRENPEEGSHRSTRSEGCPSPARDLPELPKSSRHRHPSMDNSLGSETSGSKTRHSRKHHSSKEHSNRGSRRSDDPNQPPDSPTSSKQLPDIPKKTRRKKSKDSVGGGSTRSSSRSSSKAHNSSNDPSFSSQFSDLGSGPDSGLLAGPETNKENNQTPFVQE